MGKFETYETGGGGRGELRRDAVAAGPPPGVEPGEDYVEPAPGATIRELIVSINELRHEISYAKYNNNDWWHSTLKRLDTQNRRIHRLTGVVTGMAWMLLLLAAAVVALCVFSGALDWPSWEQFSQLWAWAR